MRLAVEVSKPPEQVGLDHGHNPDQPGLAVPNPKVIQFVAAAPLANTSPALKWLASPQLSSGGPKEVVSGCKLLLHYLGLIWCELGLPYASPRIASHQIKLSQMPDQRPGGAV